MRFISTVLILSTTAIVWATKHHDDTFHESLTLHPLPDGKLSISFEFITYFTRHSSTGGNTPSSHHSLTPPSLLLPLERNNVSELTISFVSGRWNDERSGEAGPLNYQAGGGGGEIRAWLRDGNEANWMAMTHALGGLFCAGLGPNDEPGESIHTFGKIYLPQRSSTRHNSTLTHHLLSHPHLPHCTENLTPFLSLLPSKGQSGLSHLLSKPGKVFSWGYKTEGIEVFMPEPRSCGDDGNSETGNGNTSGRWRGWWEGVVDLVPVQQGGGREFNLESVFGSKLAAPFPLASTSVLRLVKPVSEDRGGSTIQWNSQIGEDGPNKMEWKDGKLREIVEWDLTGRKVKGKDISFNWQGEGHFRYPRKIVPPLVSVSRTVGSRLASDGTLLIRITNNGAQDRPAVYSEIWPWWVKGWMSEIRLSLDGNQTSRPDLLQNIEYHPSLPPKVSTTTIHFDLTLPAKSTLLMKIPFTKLTLKYTEHRPDAERGIELSSGILTLLDQIGDSPPRSPTVIDIDTIGDGDGAADGSGPETNDRKSSRYRIYTSKLLLDLPTPDFSMPYNVIIMSSTVMAVCFGLMQGALGRRWGYVQLGLADAVSGAVGLVKGKTD